MAIEVKGRLGIYRFSKLPTPKACIECGGLTRWKVSASELGPVCVPICRRCWGIIGLRQTEVVQAVMTANNGQVVARLNGEYNPARVSGDSERFHEIQKAWEDTRAAKS